MDKSFIINNGIFHKKLQFDNSDFMVTFRKIKPNLETLRYFVL